MCAVPESGFCIAPEPGDFLRQYILRQLEPDPGNLRHDRSPLGILADPPWHIDAVGGRSHQQSRAGAKNHDDVSQDFLTRGLRHVGECRISGTNGDPGVT